MFFLFGAIVVVIVIAIDIIIAAAATDAAATYLSEVELFTHVKSFDFRMVLKVVVSSLVFLFVCFFFSVNEYWSIEIQTDPNCNECFCKHSDIIAPVSKIICVYI